jgi:putative DNA primase/helicase
MKFQSKIDAALAYAAAGVAVFPVHSVEHGQCSCGNAQCKNKGKHPRTPKGLKDATIDTSQVKSWWESFPNANIGMRTGRKSGLFVVDIDGEEGFQWLNQQSFPRTPMVRTGGGGLHVFFRFPEDREIKNSAKKIAPQVDIRGDGGYVIAPPSNHASGNSYEWIQSPWEIPFAEAPQELLDQITTAKTKKAKPAATPTGAFAMGQYWGAAEGTRDEALFRYACSLESYHYEAEDFREKIFEANQRNNPPLEDAEVEKIIASAQKYFLRNALVEKMQGLSTADLCAEVFKPETLEIVKKIYQYDPAAWAKLKLALRKARILKEVTTALGKMLHAERAHDPGTAVLVSEAMSTSHIPIPDGIVPELVMPAGYGIAEMRIYRVVEGTPYPVSPSVILPITRIKTTQTQEEMLEVVSWDDSGWRSLTVNRSQVSDTKKITQLSDYGLFVSSVNAKELVRYFHNFLDVNQHVLPIREVSNQLGWVRDSTFLLRETISKESVRIAFRPNDGGDHQIYESLSSTGTLAGWLDAIQALQAYPKALVALYASFAAPLLRPLNLSNVLVDFSGLTSTGKTTCQRVAASVWGNPDERSGTSFVRNWDTTKVGLERTLARLNDLPCVIDDSKKAEPRRVEQFIYLLVNGQWRMRGSRAGLAENFNWRTVGISSGEAPITSYAVSSGAMARVIPIKGSPFGQSDSVTRKVVDELNRQVRENHGHAGPVWMRWIIDHMPEWPSWKERYDAIRYRFDDTFGAASRLADACALISLTGELVHEALKLTWNYCDPLGQLWETIAEEFNEIDVGVRALREVYEVAVANPGRFYCKGKHPISENCYGAWDYDEQWWQSLNFIPSVLKARLNDLGYRSEEILQNWREKGWLVLDHENYNPRHTLGTARTRLISIHRTAIMGVVGDIQPLVGRETPLFEPLYGNPPLTC